MRQWKSPITQNDQNTSNHNHISFYRFHYSAILPQGPTFEYIWNALSLPHIPTLTGWAATACKSCFSLFCCTSTYLSIVTTCLFNCNTIRQSIHIENKTLQKSTCQAAKNIHMHMQEKNLNKASANGKNKAHLFLIAGLILCSIGIIFLSINPVVVYDKLECIVHESTLTATIETSITVN